MELGLWVLNITNNSIPWSSCISRNSTKSVVFDMAFFTCLTTVKQQDRERSAGTGKWKGWGGQLEEEKRDLMKILEVLTFLTKPLGTAVCSGVLYLAILILFRAEVCASDCLFFCLSVHLSTPRLGRLGGGRTWKLQSGFRSPWANRSERLPWHIISEVTLRTTLSGLEIFKAWTPFAVNFQSLFFAARSCLLRQI